MKFKNLPMINEASEIKFDYIERGGVTDCAMLSKTFGKKGKFWINVFLWYTLGEETASLEVEINNFQNNGTANLEELVCYPNVIKELSEFFKALKPQRTNSRYLNERYIVNVKDVKSFNIKQIVKSFLAKTDPIDSSKWRI